MKGFILYSVKVIVIAFFVMECICFSLMYSFRDTLFYKTNHAHTMANTQYGFVILGSSRGLTSLDTKAIMQATGQSGFNYSMDDTHIGSQRVMLNHLIHHNIRFDTLFLVYENTAKHVTKIATSDYRFLPFSSHDYVKQYYTEKNAPQSYSWMNVMPFIPMAYFNTELFFPSVYTMAKRQLRYRYDAVGDYDYPVSGKIDSSLQMVDVNLNFDNDDLNAIADICKVNGIALIVLVTPSYHTNYTYSGNSEAFTIIDLSRETITDTGFYDRIHLNKGGKDSLTSALLRHL